MISRELLIAAVGCTPADAAKFEPHLNLACSMYDIRGDKRLAAFLAQVGHESGSFRWVRELWGPTAAQLRYEGREDLGNVQPGDGERFMGRGLIQNTGRWNAARLRDNLRARGLDAPDFEQEPQRMEEPRWAALSAGDYWDWKGLNALADADKFERITRLINGGLNGQADRVQRWEKAKLALGAAPKQEKEVDPFTIAALAAVTKAVPALIDMFKGDSKSAERNAEAAKVVVEIAKEAVAAKNEQELVTKLESEPQAREEVKKAVEDRWFEIHRANEQSVDKAREWGMRYSQLKDVRIVTGNMTFIELLTLMMFAAGTLGGLGVVMWGDVGPALNGSIITLILVESVVGVRKYWLGNSAPEGAKEANRGGT